MQPDMMKKLNAIFQGNEVPKELVDKIDKINTISVSVGRPKADYSMLILLSADYFEYDPKTKTAKLKEMAKTKPDNGYVHNLVPASKVNK